MSTANALLLIAAIACFHSGNVATGVFLLFVFLASLTA